MKSFVEIKLNNVKLNEKGLVMKNRNCIDCGIDIWHDSTRCKSCSSIKHGETKTKLYRKWVDMRHRCYSPKNKRYSDYGGRGIAVCSEWYDDFIPFRDWSLRNGYYDGCKLSIDRIDNNGDYSPENCRYATQAQQMRNTRVLLPSNTSGYRGVTKSAAIGRWTARIKVNQKHIHIGSYGSAKEAGDGYDKYVLDNGLEYPLNSSIGDN